LDTDKDYWVGDDEVDKLLQKGDRWLAGHPEREAIAKRYLRYDRRLTSDALSVSRKKTYRIPKRPVDDPRTPNKST
jgi:hypothetical protein